MHRRTMISFLIFVLLAGTPKITTAIEGLPGKMWGTLGYQVPQNGEDSLVMRGWFQQGVDWLKLGRYSYFNTFVSLNYVWDREGFDWNNKIGPSVGVQVNFYHLDFLTTSLGALYYWDNNYAHGNDSQGAYLFVDWYGQWDLLRK